MEETNVTMTAAEMQGEPAAKENETKAEKFIRIGEYRMNKAVDAIGRLENLANRSSYEYTQEQVDAMFQALEGRVAEVKSRFAPKKHRKARVSALVQSNNCNNQSWKGSHVVYVAAFCRIYDRKENCVRKYDFISALAKETAAEVVKNREEWMKYLTTAARLYKYPFREQLLIYAQRPDATACASIELWNERMHCWVNKGAKGIALLDEDDAHGKRLKYVFDVSDVHAARRIGRYPELWELHEEHKEDVIKRLEQTYGATDDKKLFEERLMELADRIAADYYEELLPDLQYMIEGSFLEGLDEQNVGIRLRDTLSESISFTLLSACGADMQEYGSEFAFDFIHEFNSMDTLAVLGDAANELAKPVLLEIGRTIRAYNRSHEQEQTENLTQKGLANTSEIDYNALKRESESGHEEYIDNNQNSVERGNSNESDIREEWGLSDPDITGGQSAGGNRNEVRNDEGDLSEGEPQGRVLSVSSERDIERTPADHSEAGRGENGEADKPDGGNRGSDRTAQGNRSDALGSEDEQHSEPSRGSGSGRTGLQSVTDTDDLLRGDAAEPTFTQLSLFPSFEEQVGTVAAAEASMKYTMPAAFSLPQNELETILRSGGGKQHSRKRIFAKYTEGRNAEQMVDFLKMSTDRPEKVLKSMEIQYQCGSMSMV